MSNTPEPNAQSAWQEVGHELESLGNSIATALRSARERTQSREQMADMQHGLRAMIDQLRQAVDDTAASPEGQQVRTDAARAVDSVRDAAETTVQELRPHVLEALRRATEELNRLNRRLNEDSSTTKQDPEEPKTSP